VTNGTESGEKDKGRRLDREWSQLQVTAAENKIVEIILALLLAAANTIGQRFCWRLKNLAPHMPITISRPGCTLS
jgi:hypothetical protein